MSMVAGLIVGGIFGLALCSCMILSSRTSRVDEYLEEKRRREQQNDE